MTKKVSVIVPNYNYEQFLPQRLNSIINQTYPIYELIFIDNASTDNSVTIAKSILKNAKFPVKIIVNEYNNGNVFKQWYKGLCLAKGNYIWIAESDDYCESTFLENMIKSFDNEEIVLSYSQSAVIDEKGNIVHNSYLYNTVEISNDWENDFIIEGKIELIRSLFFKNVIPNVSAVVFKKENLEKIFVNHKDEIFKFKVAGDWFVYVLLANEGKFAFNSKVLNYHRTHLRTNRYIYDYSEENDWVRNYILENFLYNNEITYKLNLKYIFKFLHYLKKEKESKEKILKYLENIGKVKFLAIFGLGKSGKMTYEFIKKYYPEKTKYFIDDNVKGEYEGIPIVTTNEFLEKYQDEVDLVVSGKYQHLNPKLLPNLRISCLRLENIM